MIASAARFREPLPYPHYLGARRLRDRRAPAMSRSPPSGRTVAACDGHRDGLLQARLPPVRGGDAGAASACSDELGFELRELDITADEALHRAYFERIPVVALDGEELCEYFVDETLVRERLESRR